MPAGENLRQRPQQYAVKFDTQTNLWRILDTYNKSLESMSAEDEIPDDHDAITVVPMAAVHEVVREANVQGLLEHMVGGVPEEEVNELQIELSQAELEIGRLTHELAIERERIAGVVPNANPEPVIRATMSEDAQIVANAIESITQIASQAQIGKVAGNGRSNS